MTAQNGRPSYIRSAIGSVRRISAKTACGIPFA